MLALRALFTRPSPLLERAASPAVLNHAWRLLRNDRGRWRQGLPVQDMGHNAILHVGELSRDLLSGRYQPEPMRCHDIPKADGSRRLICTASARDKLAQRAVLTVLEPLGEAIFHDASFGFRPQCTLDMALARVREWVRRGYGWLGDADIEACFDHIPHRPLMKDVRRLCRDPAIQRLIHLWLDSMPDRYRPAGPGRGLPQGMVLSPFLCNLYLHRLDRQLERRGVPFVRFADDFLLLGRDQREAEHALSVAGRILTRLDLKLHPDKSRVIRSSRRHHFLGKRLPEAGGRARP